MAFDAFYATGTVTVSAGGAAVTGTGTLWTAALLPGDAFEAGGRSVRILDVVDDTHLTLAYGWPGAAIAAGAYLVVFNAPSRSTGTYVAERLRELIERQRLLDTSVPSYVAAGVGINAPPGAPAAGDLYVVGTAPTGAWAGYAGYVAVATDAGGWRFTAAEHGWRVYDTATDTEWVRTGSAWLALTPISAALLGAVNGVATLDSAGKVPVGQLPALAISEVFPVASQAAMLALTAQVGDIAIRSDLNKTFVLAASPSSTLANWAEMLAPTGAVTSVAGRTGAVVLTKADVGLSNVANTAPAALPISDLTQAALDTKSAILRAVTSIAGGSHTLTATDVGTYLRFIGSGAKTCTLPNDSTENLPVGAQVDFAAFNGTLTVSGEAGVTVNAVGGTFATGRGGLAVKVGANQWDVFGGSA